VRQYVTISAKIPRRLKELLDKYGIKPGPIIRRALEEEVKKRILAELEEEARRLSEKLSHISDEEIASLIRENREKR
jgi:polyhydroxyalkanoate synthesis regulator phasin